MEATRHSTSLKPTCTGFGSIQIPLQNVVPHFPEVETATINAVAAVAANDIPHYARSRRCHVIHDPFQTNLYWSWLNPSIFVDRGPPPPDILNTTNRRLKIMPANNIPHYARSRRCDVISPFRWAEPVLI